MTAKQRPAVLLPVFYWLLYNFTSKNQLSLPESLIRSLQNLPGFNEESFKAVHQSGEQITSVRLNPGKKLKPQTSALPLKQEVPWSSSGFYLTERPSFTLQPLFHAGAYYVQEASSMFLEQVLKQSVDLLHSLKVLDLCAAPGGKSTLIQTLISKQSLLVSNEVIKTRVNILAENITKWGAANVIVTNNDPKDFQRLPHYFDVIVVDAPCSGSGLFRKDTNAISEWSESNVALCAQRQQRILADIMPSLKPGGVLIYSTCSYSEVEDEAMVDWLTGEFAVETVRLNVDNDWGIVESQAERSGAYGYRFYPHRVKGEGFFIAVFKNTAAAESNAESNFKIRDRKDIAASLKESEVVKPYLANAGEYFLFRQNEEMIALPFQFKNELLYLQSALYIKKAGVKLGTVIRNELLPAHELALSNIIHPDVAKLEVDHETALQYLRKADVQLTAAVKGWALITHQQMPLGWIKILPNRINNYYPKEWRILNK